MASRAQSNTIEQVGIKVSGYALLASLATHTLLAVFAARSARDLPEGHEHEIKLEVRTHEPESPVASAEAPNSAHRNAGGHRRHPRTHSKTRHRLKHALARTPSAQKNVPTETPPKQAQNLATLDLALHRQPAPAYPDPASSLPPAASQVGRARTYNGGSFSAHIAQNGSVEFDRTLPTPRLGAGKIVIPFDTTDALMSLAGQDVYAYDKRKFMEATRTQRQAMADQVCDEQLSEAVLTMHSQLEAIWNDRSQPIEKRRRVIFKLWDQCAEDGSQAVKQTSQQIRAIILDFIKNHLPQGSHYAFSPTDLARLNRSRRSQNVFAPYQ